MTSVSVCDSKLVALRAQALALFLVVLDDAVVHHGEFAVADVGMGVGFGDAAVRGPAGVADAQARVEAFRVGGRLPFPRHGRCGGRGARRRRRARRCRRSHTRGIPAASGPRSGSAPRRDRRSHQQFRTCSGTPGRKATSVAAGHAAPDERRTPGVRPDTPDTGGGPQVVEMQGAGVGTIPAGRGTSPSPDPPTHDPRHLRTGPRPRPAARRPATPPPAHRRGRRPCRAGGPDRADAGPLAGRGAVGQRRAPAHRRGTARRRWCATSRCRGGWSRP